MKEFNKEKELHKLKFKNNKNKYIKYASIILSTLILLIGIIYFTFAKFETNKSYTLIQGKLGDYSSGDINIAFNVDGNSSNTMPSKGTGYKYKRAECNDNNVEVIFNKNEWYATVTKVTQKTKCTLYFETVTEVEVKLYGGVNEIITVDNDDTYTMDSTGKLENVTLSVDEHELSGSISNQTFTINVDDETTEVYAMPNNGDGVIYWYGYKGNVILSSGLPYTKWANCKGSEAPEFYVNNINIYSYTDAYCSIIYTANTINAAKVYSVIEGIQAQSGIYGYIYNADTNYSFQNYTALTSSSIITIEYEINGTNRNIILSSSSGRKLKLYALWYE